MGYQWFRNGAYINLKNTANQFTDDALAPSTTYTYSVYTIDFHMNASPTVSFTVTTPPAGAIDPRQTGVRPQGFACFGGANNLLASGRSALSAQDRRYLKAALEAQQNGESISGIANAVATAGFNSEYPAGVYGETVKDAAEAIARRKDCP